MDKEFIKLCKDGKINELEKYYSEHQNINIHANNEVVFRWSCKNGRLELAKWLIEVSQTKNEYVKTGLINIHANMEDSFRWSCRYGHLEVAKWLIELSQTHKEYMKLGLINIHAKDDYAFRYSSENGHIEVTTWLYLLDKGKINVIYINKWYDDIEDDKILVRIIGCDYKNNNLLRNEYKKEYLRWKFKINAKMICKILKFYKYVLEKSYSPNGLGYSRTKNDFYSFLKN